MPRAQVTRLTKAARDARANARKEEREAKRKRLFETRKASKGMKAARSKTLHFQKVKGEAVAAGKKVLRSIGPIKTKLRRVLESLQTQLQAADLAEKKVYAASGAHVDGNVTWTTYQDEFQSILDSIDSALEDAKSNWEGSLEGTSELTLG